MAFFRARFDAGRRFERNYAEFLVRRLRTAFLPGGARLDIEHDYIPVRGLNAALAHTGPVLLTGEAGAGKTSILTQLALRHAHALAAGSPNALVPVFFSASTAQAAGAVPSLARVLDYLDLTSPLTAQAPRDFFAVAVASGRALVLIDDLDALPPAAVETVISEFANARIVAAARAPMPSLYDFPLPGFRDQDIEAFARRWSPQNAAGFVASLKASRVPRSLTANPLMLMLLTRVCRVAPRGSETCHDLATRRFPLFDEYAQTVLKGDADSATLLANAALAALRGQRVPIDLVERGHGFLLARKNGTAGFVHSLWQAYFAARALGDHPDSEDVSAALHDPQWLDTLLFHAGMVDPGDRVEALVSQGSVVHAARLLAQAQASPPGLRERVTQGLLRRMSDGDTDALGALAELDGDAVVDSLAARFQDADPVVRMHAARTLGALRLDRGVDILLRQLRDPDPDVRDEVFAALGQARTDRVLEPLLVALRGDPRLASQNGNVDTRLRVAAARALGDVGSDKAMPALVVEMSSGEPEVRAAAAQALKRIASPLMLRALASLAQSGDEAAREYARDVLAVVQGP